MAYPMSEAKLPPLRVDFDRRLKLDFHGSDISSDVGLLPYRELDHALGLAEAGGEVLSETRRGKNTRHFLAGRIEAEWLATDDNLAALTDRSGA